MNLKNKKILLTGGHGFLGKHVFSELSKREPAEIFIPHSETLDLRERKNCQKAVKNKDVVIHLAGKVGGIGFNQKCPGEIFYDNLIMGVELMEAARKEGAEKFIVAGTICAYPKFSPVPFKEEHLFTGYPEETNAPYGLAKLMLLVQAQAYRQQYEFNTIYLLIVNLYGHGDNFDPEASHVIPALIKKIYEAIRLDKEFIEVWGSGKTSREFLYVEDAARAIVLATEKYDKPEPVNIGAGFETTIKELAEKICSIMNYRGEIRWDLSKPDGQPRRCLDVSKAEKEFGFKAETDFENGLRKTIDWFYSTQP